MIGMKTPDEIKNGLRGCADKGNCEWCSLARECEEDADALAYITQLEKNYDGLDELFRDAVVERNELAKRLAQLEREKQAMLRDMQMYSMCGACKHFVDGKKCPMYDDCDYAKVGRFEWRGICPENTKDDAGV